MASLRKGINILGEIMSTSGGDKLPTGGIFVDRNDEIYDSSWVYKSFMVSPGDLPDNVDRFNATSSSAMFKFSDSFIGGSGAINPRPQGTRYADLPSTGSLNRGTLKVRHPNKPYGLGRGYSETQDDHNHRIYMTFGVPEFSSLLKFFFTFSNANARSWAQTGHGSSIFRTAGEILGTYFAVFSPLRWGAKLIAAGLIIRAGTELLGALDNSFYSIRPTMPAYWLAVSSMVNDISVNLGLMPTKPGDDKSFIRKVGKTQVLDGGEIKTLSEELPDGVMSESGFINVVAMIRRNYTLKRIAQYQPSIGEKGNTIYNGYNLKRDKDGKIIEQALPSYPVIEPSITGLLQLATTAPLEKFTVEYVGLVDKSQKSLKPDSVEALGDVILDNTSSVMGGIWDGIISNIQDQVNNGPEKRAVKEMYDENGEFIGDGSPKAKNSIEAFKALERFTADSGLTYVVVEVDAPSSPSETFSNSVESSPIASAVNASSSIGRKLKYSLAGGNIAGGALESVTESITDLAAGTLNGFSFGITNFVENLFHGVNMEAPSQWSGSESSLSNVEYKMQLVSPYPHPYSQLKNLYIPMCTILAGVLPLKAGNRSHVSPFLVRLYDRGTNVVNMGIISNVTVSRAFTNQGYDTDSKPLSFEITFTITNLEEILSMPMASGSTGLFGLADQVGTSQYTDYMASLTGLSIDLSQNHAFLGSKAKLGLAKLSRSFEANKQYHVLRAAETAGTISSLFTKSVDYRRN